MGGGGGLLGGVTDVLFGSPEQPATPDYAGAAQATASGNLDAARAASAANRVNQYTPYGNLIYNQSGTDQYGNPTWSATTNLSGIGQQLLDMQNNTSLGLGGAINAQLGQVNQKMGQGFNPQTGPITTSVDPARLQTQTDYQGGMQGWDKASNLMMQRIAPAMQMQQKALDAKLASQGVVPGTEAYNRAQMQLGMQQNDLLNQTELSGLSAGNTLFQQGLQGAQFGNAANQQMFANRMSNANLGNTAQQQQYNQAMTNYNMPLNTLSALRSGAQVQNPSFVNVPQQATTAGADYLGAMGLSQQNEIANANAANAQSNAMMSGLFSLGGAGIAKYSDIRTKENIKAIGWLPNGLPVYEYEYKSEWKDKAGHGVHVGVMAHEVEEVLPQAVVVDEHGIKKVRYDLL
jgi:hypothetical protein